MWPYWFLFLLIAFAAMAYHPAFPRGPSSAFQRPPMPAVCGALRHGKSGPGRPTVRELRLIPLHRIRRLTPHRQPLGWPTAPRSDDSSWLLSSLGVVVALMVGLRYEVGGDWSNYLRNFAYLRSMRLELTEVLQQADPGYELLSWLAIRLDFGIWMVNLFCGIVFSVGLVAFARRQPDPLLVLVVAVPYLIVVVAMGYTRQAVAIGFAMLAFNALRDNAMLRFILWIAAAGTFHGTAMIVVLVGLVANVQNWRYSLLLGLPATFVLFNSLLRDRIENFTENYWEAAMTSDGAFIRVVMCALPAVIFLVWRRRFGLQPIEFRVWSILALLSVLALGAFFVVPSSTVIDRLALYLLPIQLFVLARLPVLLARSSTQYRNYSLGIMAYSAAIMAVWLNYASHAYAWIPYGFYPLSAAAP